MGIPGTGTRPQPSHLRALEGRAGVSAAEQDERDERLAHHAVKLRDLVAGHHVPNAWAEHLLPLLDKLQARATHGLLASSGDDVHEWKGYQKALHDFPELVAGQIEVGQKAISYLFARRTAQMLKKEREESAAM